MYMVHQRTTTAVRDAYRGADRAVIERELAESRRSRAWLESLQIDPAVRASLVEPIAILEEAFAEIARTTASPPSP